MDCLSKSQASPQLGTGVSAGAKSSGQFSRLYQGYSAALISQVPYTVILLSSFDFFDNTLFAEYKQMEFDKFDDHYFVEKFMARFGAATLGMFIA